MIGVRRRLPEGWSELITHPGIPDPELTREYPWGYDWEGELRALCAEEVRRELVRLGIVRDGEERDKPRHRLGDSL